MVELRLQQVQSWKSSMFELESHSQESSSRHQTIVGSSCECGITLCSGTRVVVIGGHNAKLSS